MPTFPTFIEASAYRAEQEAKGLKCRIIASLEGFTVECKFELAFQGMPKPEPERVVPEEKRMATLAPPREVSIPNLPELRDYQMEAATGALTNRHFLIVLPTGEGKTETALYIINQLKVSTLIVVPTLTLVSQWQQRIAKYGGIATTVSGESVQFSPLTVITYASALNYLPDVLRYRLIVFDEVHHAFAPEYRRIIETVIERDHTKLVGLTASPREYGEAERLQDQIFPERYIRTIAERQTSEQRVPLRLEAIRVPLGEEEQIEYDIAWKKYRNALKEFGYDFMHMVDATKSRDPNVRKLAYSGVSNYTRIKKLLSEDPRKIDEAANIIRSHSGQFIVFGDTTDMVDEIYDRLTKDGIVAARIHYNLKQNRAARDRIIEMLRTGETRVLVGAISIAEGLDIPTLQSAIFVSIVPRTTRLYIQRLGRIMRPGQNKIATLYITYAPGTIEQDNLEKIKGIVSYEEKYPKFMGEIT